MELGPWLRYLDENGLGAAQPDALVVLQDLLWIFECKLTYTGSARGQLFDLYLPLCAYIYPEQEPLCVQVCYNLDGATPTGRDFGEILEDPNPYGVLHWMR